MAVFSYTTLSKIFKHMATESFLLNFLKDSMKYILKRSTNMY